MAVRISGVEPGSPCAKKHIAAGDMLISVNANEITDVLDYRFYIQEKRLTLEILRPDGAHRLVRIKKREEEDIGLEFDTYLMDKQRSCKNKCIFCFIDQLPKGLRESLYFKDDDSRLSFFFGNYITMTNLEEQDIERIIKLHISPINISVHTMNPELRVKMMKNPRSGEVLKYIYKLAQAGIKINTQLVLCPGVNDGKELEYTLEELGKLHPAVVSIAAVPVGLSDHREGLEELKPFDKQSAGEVIDIIDNFNAHFEWFHHEKIAHAADEFYLKAQREMPGSEYYNGFPQLEDGVGLWTGLRDEFTEALSHTDLSETDCGGRRVVIATGKAAHPLICELSGMLLERVQNLEIEVIAVENKLFGSQITVAGLLGGRDIADALADIAPCDEVLVPAVALRHEDNIFLDDMTLDELSKLLNVKVTPSDNDGMELLRAMLGGAI